jgi:hypothetical protein
VRFQYESHDRESQWWRSYGDELWEFDENGLMRRREASINDLQIDERERRIFGPRWEAERDGNSSSVSSRTRSGARRQHSVHRIAAPAAFSAVPAPGHIRASTRPSRTV